MPASDLARRLATLYPTASLTVRGGFGIADGEYLLEVEEAVYVDDPGLDPEGLARYLRASGVDVFYRRPRPPRE